MSYSRISLQDVMHKLSLDSIEDTEFIVAKAIADGVIDADIDRKQKFVHSKVRSPFPSLCMPIYISLSFLCFPFVDDLPTFYLFSRFFSPFLLVLRHNSTSSQLCLLEQCFWFPCWFCVLVCA